MPKQELPKKKYAHTESLHNQVLKNEGVPLEEQQKKAKSVAAASGKPTKTKSKSFEEEKQAELTRKMNKNLLEQLAELEDEEEGTGEDKNIQDKNLDNDEEMKEGDDDEEWEDAEDESEAKTSNPEAQGREPLTEHEKQMMEYLKDTPNEQQDEKKAFDEDDKRRAVPFEIGKILAQKIREKQGEISVSMKADPEYKDTGSKFHPKVQRTFKKVGLFLTKYKSGPFPKPFFLLKDVPNWEELLLLTDPEMWTAQAIKKSLEIIHSWKEDNAATFLNLVFLPYIHNFFVGEITAPHRKLDHVLYYSFRPALWKPQAFFKGFLLPLCESGNCLNREAEIVSSSIKKKKIDVTMASVVIYKLLQMEFSNPILIFINTLVMKKYKLPEPVIQEFSKWVINCYKSKNGQMPSLWQKTVQFFVSFYGNFMKNETKKKVLNCMSSKHKSLLAEEGKEKKKEEEKKKMEEEKEKVVVVEKDDEEMEEEGYKRLTKAEKLKKAKDAKKTKIIIK